MAHDTPHLAVATLVVCLVVAAVPVTHTDARTTPADSDVTTRHGGDATTLGGTNAPVRDGTDPATFDATTAISDGAESGARPNESDSRVGPRVLAVYPNPVAEGDRGEYVRLLLPPGAWLLSDGETTVALDGPGRVTVTPDHEAVEHPGRTVRADLTLSNGGERLVVWPARPTANDTRPNTTDAPATRPTEPAGDGRPTTRLVVYRDASEGEVWRPGPGAWRPAGYDPRPVVPLGPTTGTAFVLPDAPRVPLDTVREADDRILLAGYTFASKRVADALVDAARRGVRVRVLVEGGPVGGMSERQARLLSRLVSAGVSVRVVGGSAPRVQYHHAKYAVVDGVALVTTENWKPSGTGGASNRGWGVRLSDARAATELAAVFRADWTARDAVPWREFRRGRTFEASDASDGTYPTAFEPRAFRANATYLLTAPGNARRGLRRIVRTADRRIDVIQPTVTSDGLLRAVKRAARRGVRVRIALSGAWYTAEENRRIVAALNRWADDADAPLSAGLVNPGGAFGKLHAKGLIVDRTVVVGSVNWTPTSLDENREVAVAVRSRTLADYFRRVAAADRRDPGDRSVPPLLAVVGVAVAALAALLVGRRVEFADVGN